MTESDNRVAIAVLQVELKSLNAKVDILTANQKEIKDNLVNTA